MAEELPSITSAHNLPLQAAAHGGVLLLLVYILTAINTWALARAPDFTLYLAAGWAFLSGLALSHILHEWGHFLGALLARARLSIRPGIFPLFFDYDYSANAAPQFLVMSYGGLLGNILLLLYLLLFISAHTLVITALVAAVAGQLVYVLLLEFPVSLGVLAGKAPLAAMEAHFGRGGPLFLAATAAGLGTAWLVFATL